LTAVAITAIMTETITTITAIQTTATIA